MKNKIKWNDGKKTINDKTHEGWVVSGVEEKEVDDDDEDQKEEGKKGID